jgi:hypothetical protein
MPIVVPALDDRSFDDLVDEVLARIPAHTPEWTYPRLGDPGRTLVELFAWLTDTLLYRANLVPERQRLAFLRLLGVPLQPALPAHGLVGLSIDNDTATGAESVAPLATLRGSSNFETTSEVTVLPVTAEAYCKRPLSDSEQGDLNGVIQGLKQLYQVSNPVPYVTTPVFPTGVPDATGFDLVKGSVDDCLWLALLAPKPELVDAVRTTLGKNVNGGLQVLNVGVAPSLAVPALFEDIGTRAPIPHVWELTSVGPGGNSTYLALDTIADSTAGLTKLGVIRLTLPATQFISAPTNDVRAALDAGVGDQPPRLDVTEKADRLVAWLRLRLTDTMHSLSLSWVGINAVEIDGRQTIADRVIGQSDGSPDQQMQLPGQSVERATAQIQVEETGLGYQPWAAVDDLALAGRNDAVFVLDSEAGTIRFGDGVRGRIPETGRRVRVALVRAGGGSAGNLPAGSLTQIQGLGLDGQPLAIPLKVFQALDLNGGADAETLPEAEQRIPALFRHSDRAVTADDYRQLVADMPGVHVGRVELLPHFKPQQRRSDVPGVVSVMVLPYDTAMKPPNPRPDRPLLETVNAYLDTRRPISTELYVIGCEYVALGITVAVSLRDGFGQDAVLNAVRDAIRAFLWPLAPGGVNGTGWDLGRPVRTREVEVMVARVAGVDTVSPINLFQAGSSAWQLVPGTGSDSSAQLSLQPWQLPELLGVVAVIGNEAPTALDAPATSGTVPIPVVPKVC